MSLYPVIWAAEHAPVRDAEERAILMALVIKGDFDGCNCFRSYGTLAKVARVDGKTAGRRCREMETRGILRRQTEHLSRAYLAIPEEQRPIVWEVMIPASFWSRVQLDDINEQRDALGRAPITAQTRPELTEVPSKKPRSDKGTKRPRKTAEASEPGTMSPYPTDYESLGNPGTISPHPGDYQSVPQGLSVPLPSETPSESPSEGNNITSAPASRDADPATARPDVERVCTHLADRIEANGSKRPTITKSWRTAARLLLDKDGRTEEQVHTAIDWCQDSEFWRANVLSMPKLRDKYDQLRLQAQRQQPGGNVVPFRDRQQQASDDLFDRAMTRAHARMAATDPPPTNTTVADPLAATTNTTAAADPLAPKEIAR